MNKFKKRTKNIVRLLVVAVAFAMTMCLGMTASAQELPVVTVVDQVSNQASAATTSLTNVPQTMTLTVTTGINEVDAMFGNLTSFISGIVKIVGIIMVLFGVVQFGLSITNHDPSQRAQSFLAMAGGVIVFFAPEIISFLSNVTGSGGTII